MKPLFRTTSPIFFWLLSAVIVIPGIYDMVSGIERAAIVDIAKGLISFALAAYLMYCAILCHKRDIGALHTPRMIAAGYVLLGLFAAALVFDILTIMQRVAS